MHTLWWWTVFALTWIACWWVATRVVMQVWQGICVIRVVARRREDAQELCADHAWREGIIQRMRKRLRDHTIMPGWLCWTWDLEAAGSVPGWIGWAITVATWPLWWTLLMRDSSAAAEQAVRLWELEEGA